MHKVRLDRYYDTVMITYFFPQNAMGQNQGSMREQEGGPAGLAAEKGPGPEEEGNPSEETCGEGEDQAGAGSERLDLVPGMEPTLPTLKLDMHSHAKRSPPIDRAQTVWMKGGDGEREGGREKEEGGGEGGRAQPWVSRQARDTRVSERGTLSSEAAGSSGECTVERSSGMDPECSATEGLDRRPHQEKLQVLGRNSFGKDEGSQLSNEQLSEDEDFQEALTDDEKKRAKLNMEAEEETTNSILNASKLKSFTLVEDICDASFTGGMPVRDPEASPDMKDSPLGHLNAATPINEPPYSSVCDGPASTEMVFSDSETKSLTLSTAFRENLALKWSSTKSDTQETRRCNETVSPTSLGEQQQTETLEHESSLKRAPVATQTTPEHKTEEVLPAETLEILNREDSTLKDFITDARKNFGDDEHQLSSRDPVRELVSPFLETGPVAAEAKNNTDLLVLNSHQVPIESGLEEHQKEESHPPASDLDSLKKNRKPDPSCNRSPAGGGCEERNRLDLFSKSFSCSLETKPWDESASPQRTEMKDATGCALSQNMVPDQSDRHDTKPCTTDLRDCPVPETASAQTEKMPERFVAVVSEEPKILSMPGHAHGAEGELDPQLALYALMASKRSLSEERGLRNGNLSPPVTLLPESGVNLPDQVMSLSEARNKSPGRDTASGEHGNKVLDCSESVDRDLDKLSNKKSEKDGDEPLGEITSSEKDRANQSARQETSASSSPTELISDPRITAGPGKDRPEKKPLVESKHLVDSSLPVDKHEPKSTTDETDLGTEDPTAVKDVCGVAGTGDAALGVHNSPPVCSTTQNKFDPDSIKPSQAEPGSPTKTLHGPSDGQNGVTVRKKSPNTSKGRPVSDLIKETIQLHEKMKEWTKPSEPKADVALDPAQSVKVAQMKAAFDPPKKSPDKALERKPSMRKGKAWCSGVALSF